MTATVTKRGALDMQVCVPVDWPDEEVKRFADVSNLCGTSCGWQIRREGDQMLANDLERRQCAEFPDHVHIMLDA